jgi:hypothetical protein
VNLIKTHSLIERKEAGMHIHFTDWHREANIEPNDETSPKHWKVIEEYTPEAKEIISLARFFYGFHDPDTISLNGFGTALQDADTKFSMQRDTLLLSVLSGAELIDVIEQHDDQQLSILAALCLLCGAAQGARKSIPVPSMVKTSARYIENVASKRASNAIVSEEPENDSKLRKLESELNIVAEETNILWWLISEYSRDRAVSWKTLKLQAASIIAGKELADLTRVIPGPVAATAFLDRIMRFSDSRNSKKNIKVMHAIESTPLEWRKHYPLEHTDLVDLMPIGQGLKLSLTIADGDDWSGVFQKGTVIEANSEMKPMVLAYQVFLERMLASLGEEIG